MDSSFRSKSFISLFILTFLLFLCSAKPALALEEGECLNTSTVVITGSITDSSGISEIIVTVDGSTPSAFNIDNGNWTATFTGLSDGPHTLLVTGTDACGSGNTATTAPLGFEVDTAAIVTITEPVEGAIIGTGDLRVTGTASSDIASVSLSANQGTWTDANPVVSGGVWSSTLQGLVAGSVLNITATGTDDCGNIGSDSVTARVPPFIWFVDDTATGNNDGSSWEDAFTTVQLAVIAAVSGDWIWVAEGTYTSDSPISSVLTMKAGVEIYGGFTGTEAELSERGNPAEQPTILDGAGTNNSVVLGASYARLDGFTIKDGNTGDGGGMFNENVTNLVVANCIFNKNQAASCGGGIANWNNSSPIITNCVFIGNSANMEGGGIYNWENSSPRISNCTFLDNSAEMGVGGGMSNWENSSPIITNCAFIGNSADWEGGGIYNNWNSSPTITNCTFAGNSAEFGFGGGMSNWSPLTTITNCIMWGDFPDEINGDPPTVSYSDIEGGYAGIGNINDDPLFVNVPDMWDITTMDGKTTTIEVADATLYAVGDVIEIEDDSVARTVSAAVVTTVTFSPALPSPSTAGMLVENWGPGATDLDEDFHLSQTAAGQGSDSICVDAGSDTAENLGMDDKTTRTDGVPDTGIVDMGYHYQP
jgi:hypothetical protein